jgi:lysophospholipase L1-like esterase
MKYPFLYSTLIALHNFPLQLCLAATATSNNDGAILVLGDSWASLSGSFLSNVCNLGSTDTDSTQRSITNNGKAGSTAKQWASGELAVESFTNAKYDYDHVWLSIGGNDFNCDQSYHDEIAQNILNVITDIFESSSNDQMEVLYTGYGYPSQDICNGQGTVSLFDHLSSAIRSKIQKSSYAKKVKVMDISSMFVTQGSSPYSDKEWYADDIHINEAGYEKLFSSSSAQEFFGCDEPNGGGSGATAMSNALGGFLGLILFAIAVINGLF